MPPPSENKVITVVLELPPKWLAINGNRSLHYTKRNQAVKHYRELAKFAMAKALGQNKPRYRSVRVHHEWFYGLNNYEKAIKAHGRRQTKGGSLKYTLADAYRPRDEDNAIAAIKAAKDGFVDAGLVMDDSHNQVKTGDWTCHRTQKEHAGKSGIVFRIEVLA